MSIVTVIQKNEIEGVENIESVLLNNKKKCIVVKNSFEVGSKGFYIRKGSIIDLDKIEDHESIKFIHKKNKEMEYKVKGLKYKNVSYDGILLKLNKELDELKSYIIKSPSYLENRLTRIELPEIIKSIQKVYCFENREVEKFMDEQLYILRYTKDALNMTIDKRENETRIYSKNTEIFDKKSIYFKTFNRINDKLQTNNVYFGKIYKGEYYIINIYDKSNERYFKCSELISFCFKNKLESGLIARYDEKFYGKKDIKKLLYVNKLLNGEKFPNEVVVVRNNEGMMLKIRNDLYTRMFFNYYKNGVKEQTTQLIN